MLLSVLAAAAALAPVQVPPRDILVVDTRGRVHIVDERGKLVRRLAWTTGHRSVQSMELSADRKHAFISFLRADLPPQLFVVDLTTGRERKLSNAVSPALNPDRKRLSYVTVTRRSDISYLTALVIRKVRAIPFASGAALGTPPERVTNWSPDGRRLAVFDGSRLRIVDVESARDVSSQPEVSGGGLAPVFVDERGLVVLANCCIGRQRLEQVDLPTGARTAFATLSSPPEQIRRLRAGMLLTVTALRELAVVTRGRVRVIARDVAAAAP